MKIVYTIGGLISPIAFGLLCAASAIAMQNGHSRGYASVGLLFLMVPIILTLAIGGVIIMSLGKGIQNGLVSMMGAFTLPATYLFALDLFRKYYAQ